MRTRLESAQTAIPLALQCLRAGELVAFPTETVYGLGADARRPDSVRKIYEAKGRPSGNPVIVHVADVEAARNCTATWPTIAQKIADRFWPGPLTLILPRGPHIADTVSAGRSTVAVRCPNHPVAHALLQAFNGPIAAPSANRSGFTSPTTAVHVLAELDGRVPLILDGGSCDVGVESTVIDLTLDAPTILRPGAITLEMLREILSDVRLATMTVATSASAASPGLHDRHYAPHTPAYRFTRDQFPAVREWAHANGPVALLSFANDIALAAPHETFLLPAAANGYARDLYAALRDADGRHLKAILVLLPDHQVGGGGLWTAVADRLRRATLPFSSPSPIA